jgi:hypothetical protein
MEHMYEVSVVVKTPIGVVLYPCMQVLRGHVSDKCKLNCNKALVKILIMGPDSIILHRKKHISL